MKKVVLVLVLNLFCYVGFAQDKSESGLSDDNKVYVQVDEIAKPAGGMQDFYMKFANKFKAPIINDRSISQVRVMLSFVVEKDGSLSDIKVLRDPGYGVGDEVVRVLRSMNKWKPALNKGEVVRTQFTLPITIQVN